jgi:hypothetical protein
MALLKNVRKVLPNWEGKVYDRPTKKNRSPVVYLEWNPRRATFWGRCTKLVICLSSCCSSRLDFQACCIDERGKDRCIKGKPTYVQ